MSKPAKKDKPILAYEVYDGGDGWAIVFETSNVAARRIGANEIGCDFNEVEHCLRKPVFDQYAPGPVPNLALLQNGWNFECAYCGQHASDGHAHEDENYIYCSKACIARDASFQRRKQASINALIELAVIKFGSDIRITHASVFGDSLLKHPSSNQVSFTFPGSTCTAQWPFGSDYVSVAGADQVAYNNWRSDSQNGGAQ